MQFNSSRIPMVSVSDKYSLTNPDRVQDITPISTPTLSAIKYQHNMNQ